MIRKYRQEDCDTVLSIWLEASIEAHHFIAATFWESQVERMRAAYLPAAESYVYEKNTAVVGFYSLYENNLAALFVSPHWQGKGIGAQLLAHAKTQREVLTLTVYTENIPSFQFYLSQGFKPIKEQVDEQTGHHEYYMSSKRF